METLTIPPWVEMELWQKDSPMSQLEELHIDVVKGLMPYMVEDTREIELYN